MQVFDISPALANPVVNTLYYYSQPQAHTVGTAFNNPAFAHDKSNSTYAWYNYGTGAATSLELITFKTATLGSAPYPVIKQVDFKMMYGAQDDGGKGETYTITYQVGSSAVQTLVAATGIAHANATEVWAARNEPNDGVWTWTDIGSIKLKVSTSGTTGPTQSAKFFAFEGWVIVWVVSSPKVFVNPSSIIDTTKVPGSTFSVDVKLENISDVFGIEFKLRYDPKILAVTPSILNVSARTVDA